MLFHVVGVKEEGKSFDTNIDRIEKDDSLIDRYNLDLLIESEDINNAKKNIEYRWIIAVSITDYKESELKFGNIFLKIKGETQDIRIISNMEEIYDTAVFFYNVGLEISDINYLDNSLDETEIQNILKEAKAYVEEDKKRLKEIIEVKKKKKEYLFSNKDIVKIRDVISEVIVRWDETLQRVIWIVDGKDIKKFKSLRDELSKLRMWTNQIKIIDRWEAYLNLMEKIEIEFLEKKKQDIEDKDTISKNSVVSNIDIMEEYSRFFKAIKTKAIWWSNKREYGDYITFGMGGMFIRFLYVDIAKKFSNIRKVIYKAYDWIEFLLIAIIVQVVIYMVLNSMGTDIELKNFVLLSNLWIIGLVVFAAKFLRKKNIIYLIILIPIIVIISIVLIRSLKINLAL